MSKRKKKHTRVAHDEPVVEPGPAITGWDRLKFVAGIVLGIYALSYLINTQGELRLWFNQQHYRQTDFTITEVKLESFGDNDQELKLIGIVALTNEEIKFRDWLITDPRIDRAPGTKHWQHFNDKEKIGVRFPIWFADAQSKVYFVSEFPEIPSDTRALTSALLNLLFIGGALYCVISVFRKAAQGVKVSESSPPVADA
jgi:hypothetical protein